MVSALLHMLLELYKLVILAYVLLKLLNIPANKWTTMIQSLVEPVLTPLRKFLQAKVPAKYMPVDWSPLALYVLTGVVQTLVRIIL